MARKGEVSRSRLLAAAERLFAERGVKGTTVSAIVAEAGLTQAAFYLYFKSKEDMVEALVNRFGEMLEQVQLFEGVPKMLGDLREMGLKLCILSSNDSGYIRSVLRRHGVALVSAKEGWAVGETTRGPFVLRLSGGKWKPARVPRIKGGFLRDVYARGARHAVAIGGVYRSSGKIYPLALEWNGKRWSRMRVPNRAAELYGVTGDGDGRLWAVGYDPARPQEPFVLRHSGGRWRTERGGGAGGDRTVRLQAVTHVTGLTMAVGHIVDRSGRYTDLIETVGGDEAGEGRGVVDREVGQDLAVHLDTGQAQAQDGCCLAFQGQIGQHATHQRLVGQPSAEGAAMARMDASGTSSGLSIR